MLQAHHYLNETYDIYINAYYSSLFYNNLETVSSNKWIGLYKYKPVHILLIIKTYFLTFKFFSLLWGLMSKEISLSNVNFTAKMCFVPMI